MTREEFKHLFDTHFDGIRNYIYYRSGDSELATDIAQETFMRMWEKQLSIIEEQKTKRLLFKMAGDLFVSSYRKRKTAIQFRLQTKPETTDHTPEDMLQFEELKSRYEAALVQMPEKQRTVFLMSRMEHLKNREIAEALNLSIKAVEKRMKGALDYLKKAIRES